MILVLSAIQLIFKKVPLFIIWNAKLSGELPQITKFLPLRMPLINLELKCSVLAQFFMILTLIQQYLHKQNCMTINQVKI